MKKNIRLILNIILVSVLIFGLVKFAMTSLEAYRSKKDYDLAKQIAAGQITDKSDETDAVPESPNADETKEESDAKIPDDPFILELLAIDLDALREENEDVIGWICIPDTYINYPLLQWTDNEFYLTHTWNQTRNPSGAIFMDCQNEPDLSEFNTIIYGHNMSTELMFSSLLDYRSPEFRQSHPYVYIVNDEGVFRYDVFAAQFAATDSIIYGLGIETERKKEEFIRYAQDYSFYETEVRPTADDRILTLSTCTGGGHSKRCVVLSVLNEENSFKRPE